MTKYGLNLSIYMKFETKVKRTAAIDKAKDLVALLSPDERVKVLGVVFDENEVTIEEMDPLTNKQINLE